MIAATSLFIELPRRGQPVEKVGIELMATTNQAQNAPKRRVWCRLVPDPGCERAPREFFNSLVGLVGNSVNRLVFGRLHSKS